MNKFSYTRELNNGILESLDDVTFSLKEQGFSIVNTINVKERIEKIGSVIDEYYVLGACNPSFASDALDLNYEIGLFFPCNVIVYVKNSNVFVSCINPVYSMGLLENDELLELSKILYKKLKLAIDNI